MDTFRRQCVGPYTITCRGGADHVDAQTLIAQLSKPYAFLKKGRGEIRILSVGDKLHACRKYIHGGLLRALTGDLFLSDKRAVAEMGIMSHLEKHGFPVVQPYGYITKRNLCTKDLYFLTFFEENAIDLVEFLKSSGQRKRMRAIRDLARLFFELGRLGVYHPDLHLKNMLITKKHGLRFLDFDKARLKSVTKRDMEHMFWRLNRFAEKKERSGEFVITVQEKVLFLRVFERLSGYRVIVDMEKRLSKKRSAYKLGWFLESLFYKKSRKN